MSETLENLIKLKLVTQQEEIHLDVVGLLEDYLELAKRGEITAIAITALKPGHNSACYGYSAMRRKLSLLGAVDLLKCLIQDDLRHGASADLLDEEDDAQ